MFFSKKLFEKFGSAHHGYATIFAFYCSPREILYHVIIVCCHKNSTLSFSRDDFRSAIISLEVSGSRLPVGSSVQELVQDGFAIAIMLLFSPES